MKKACVGAVMVASLLLAGCAAPYGKDNGYGGYSDSSVEKDLYRVVFTSPGGLDDGAIHDLALLRAAQVSRDHGFTGFIVVKENKGYTTRAALTAPPGAYPAYAAHPQWVPGAPGHGPSLVMVYDNFGPDWPNNVAVSTRYDEMYLRAVNEGASYDAARTIAEMQAKYKLGGK